VAKPLRSVQLYSTVQFTWVSSIVPSSLTCAIKTSSETYINSAVAAVQSAGGAYYAFITMTTTFPYYPVSLVAEWTATASTMAGTASPFIDRLVFDLDYTQAFPQGRRQ
jgi:hypothetical protein